MSRIAELWRTGMAPTVDGLYRADGSARAAQVDGPKLSWFELESGVVGVADKFQSIHAGGG